MTDQESPRAGIPGRQPPRRRASFRRARRLVSSKRGVAVVGVLFLVVLWITTVLAPGTSSGFNATISNGGNALGTNVNFSPSGGVLPYSDAFPSSDLGWNDYGGTWATSGGVYSESAGGNTGNKAVSGLPTWTDYTVQGDVRVNTGTQAGLLFRVQSPGVGADTLKGYYLGVYTGLTGSLTLGRENNSYAQLASTTTLLPANGTWYHVTAQVTGCTIVGSMVQVGTTNTPSTLTYTDSTNCFASGAIGVRDFGSTASFRNITATAGGTTTTAVATYNAPFASSATGWTSYGGTWTQTSATESYNDTTGGQGEKATAGTATWGNYSLTGDVELNSSSTTTTSAGFLVRVSSPATGVNAFKGYYAGLSSTTLVLQKSDGTTLTTLASGTLPSALPTATWYHLTVEAVGCQITATAQAKTGSVLTIAQATDTGCTTTTGLIGTRVVGTTASFRDVAVTPR